MSDANTPEPTAGDEAGPTEKPMPTLWEQMGGMVGFISASIPVAVFVIVNWAASMWPAIWSAMGAAVFIAVWRLIRKEQLMPAVSGFFGVAIAAFIAYRVGEAKGFFLYGIWVSMVFGGLFILSIIVRWPLVGVIWSALNGHGLGWHSDPKSRRDYDLATVGWTLVFASRVVVQQWLYDSNETTLLGVARLAMGYPLTAIALILTVWTVRRVDRRQKAREAAEQAEAEDVEAALRAKYDSPS